MRPIAAPRHPARALNMQVSAMRNRWSPTRRGLVALAALVGLAGPLAATAAEFDLCVRGTGLGFNRIARLKLSVQGVEPSAQQAPRLGAALVNQRFWNGAAPEVFGAPFDADLCGEEVAPELKLAVTLTAGELEALAGAGTRSGGAESPQAYERALRTAASGNTRSSEDVVRTPDGQLLYHVVRVYYSTNRKALETADIAERFGGERGPLSFGAVNVTVPRSHRVGALEAPSILRLEFKPDPAKHVVMQSLRVLDHDAWRAEIAKRATALGNAGILVFIHGYNVRFEDAARRAGQLAHDLSFAGPTVLFSWPSRGGLVDYTVDEQAAEWSIPDMKAVLASLATVAPGTPVYVVAHSMGNRVMTRGFKALLDEDPNKRRAFRQIVMAAPDIDADVFRREIGPGILGKGPRVTLYASSNDKALVASRKVHGGYRRLGESGDSIVVMRDLDTVDASAVSTEFLGHSYFGDSTTVMSDLIHVIHKSLPPQERARFSLEPVRSALGVYWRFKGQ
jgi:esterase/lipase superfamily enzyme